MTNTKCLPKYNYITKCGVLHIGCDLYSHIIVLGLLSSISYYQ